MNFSTLFASFFPTTRFIIDELKVQIARKIYFSKIISVAKSIVDIYLRKNIDIIKILFISKFYGVRVKEIQVLVLSEKLALLG